MTTPTTDAREREAREDVERIVQVSHLPACRRVKKVRGKWVIDRLVKCDCGEGDKGNATIDAYRTAILESERARVRAVVEAAPGYQRQGLFVSRADILARLDAEPTP